MIYDKHDATPVIAPEAQNGIWIRQYAGIVLAMATVYEVFAIPRATLLGFSASDRVNAVLYTGLIGLFCGRAKPATLAAYALIGFALVEVFTWVAVGFAGPAALVPCVLPVLAALFVGGRIAPPMVMFGSLLAFVAVGVLRVSTSWLPPLDMRLVDPRVPGNWINLALALAAVVGPVVWLVGRVVKEVERSFADVERARSAHEAEVRLRIVAEAALDRALERAQEARQAEASGLVVAGVVHDLRNHLNALRLAAHGVAHGPADGPDGAGDDPDAVSRIRALCGEAGKVAGDLLSAARPRVAETRSRCLVVEETSAVAGVLGASLPPDFRITFQPTLARDRRAGIDAHTLASAVLGIVVAAGVTSAAEHHVYLIAREPTAAERESLSECSAVVELRLGCDPSYTGDGAGELLAQRGGRMLQTFYGSDHRTCLLLPPVAPTLQPEHVDV
jgi:signal transduction histidine kinase